MIIEGSKIVLVCRHFTLLAGHLNVYKDLLSIINGINKPKMSQFYSVSELVSQCRAPVLFRESCSEGKLCKKLNIRNEHQPC